MNKIMSLVILSFVSLVSSASADIRVSGYYRSNGTYVQSYMRTAPNNTINDNYSTQGNTNPYTGREGTVAQNPYQPSYSPPSYQPTYYYPTTPVLPEPPAQYIAPVYYPYE